jgi:hypothetical protein
MCGRFHEPEPKDCYQRELWASVARYRDSSSKTGSPKRIAVWTLQTTVQAVRTEQATDAGSQTQVLWTPLQSTCAHACDTKTRVFFFEEFHERRRKDNIKADF